jgi:putative endonuclease
MSVTEDKQRRISRAAVLYLQKSRRMNCPVRFDVIEIRPDSVRHIPNAFQPGNMFYR